MIDVSKFLIPPKIEEKYEMIINPLITPSTLLEKCEIKAIYNPRLKKYHEIVQKTYSYPVYLPEICVLLSLDITSIELAEELYDKAKDYEGLISEEGRIFCCRTYNYQSDKNRMVSWGNLRNYDLDYEIYNLYRSNLLNDFYITPSISNKGVLISPNRWFYIYSESSYRFEAFLNYNFGVIYIEKEKLSPTHVKTIKAWLNFPLKLYTVTAGFINFQPDGSVGIKPILLHFTEDPCEKVILEGKGDYFVSFLISFNDYSTSYEKASIKKGNINIVETLTKLVYTPYEILPMLFPLVIDDESLNNLIYRFTIEKKAFERIFFRLTKFSHSPNPDLIRAFEEFIRKQNPLLNIEEKNKYYHVEIANPGVIPFLIKKLIDKDKKSEKIKKILEESEEQAILKKIKRLDELSRSNHWYNLELSPIYGIDRVLKPRANVLKQYIKIFKELL